MSIIIYESKFENEEGLSVERNLHKEIIKHISEEGIESEKSILNIQKEVDFLKTKGFNVVYSLRIVNESSKEFAK